MSMRRCEIVQQLRFLSEEQIKNGITGRRSIKYCAYILHDKDEYTEEDEKKNPEHKAGTLKEPHWHIVLVFFDGQQQQIKYIARWFEQPPNTIEKVKSPRVEDAFAYLIHQNSPSKYQYDVNEVKTLCFADYKWFLAAPKTVQSFRTIKLGKYTKELLLKHKAEQEKLKESVGDGWVHPNIVFTSAIGNYYDRT